MQGPQLQLAVPMTPMVKRLIIANMALWVGLILILQKWILNQPYIFSWFGFVPSSVLLDFWLWQPFTYMFIHSDNVFHVIFNMLVVWWFGADLESRWGGRFFLLYYLVCGAGAAFLYLGAVVVYSLATGDSLPLSAPVVGASGAVFGLMYAYGKLFGDRMIYFMMMFPMKARMFVMLIGAVEVLNLLSSGLQSQTANLAHLGGLVVGFGFLKFWDNWQSRGPRRRAAQKHGRTLKLVVNNETSSGDKNPPRYWN
ncbi:MAG: rhomboid family intramembrane serine protease [Bdellovibrionales bacterium]